MASQSIEMHFSRCLLVAINVSIYVHFNKAVVQKVWVFYVSILCGPLPKSSAIQSSFFRVLFTFKPCLPRPLFRPLSFLYIFFSIRPVPLYKPRISRQLLHFGHHCFRGTPVFRPIKVCLCYIKIFVRTSDKWCRLCQFVSMYIICFYHSFDEV